MQKIIFLLIISIDFVDLVYINVCCIILWYCIFNIGRRYRMTIRTTQMIVFKRFKTKQ